MFLKKYLKFFKKAQRPNQAIIFLRVSIKGFLLFHCFTFSADLFTTQNDKFGGMKFGFGLYFASSCILPLASYDKVAFLTIVIGFSGHLDEMK
jgi:hypothetical protein